MKLVSLYKGSVKINSKNIDNIFTVNDLVKNNQYQRQWALPFGKCKLKVFASLKSSRYLRFLRLEK